MRKIRRRYLKFKITSERKCTTDDASDAILKATLHTYGIYGLSHIAPMLIDFDEEEQVGILRCNHTHLRQMKTSLANITVINESASAIIVLRVSGTIRSLRS